MIKLSINNQAKLEASWEIMNDDLNNSNGNPIGMKELNALYKPFCKELHQIFGDLPEIDDFNNALNNQDITKAKQLFTPISKWVHELLTQYSKKNKMQILLTSYKYKDGTIKHFKDTTFKLDK